MPLIAAAVLLAGAVGWSVMRGPDQAAVAPAATPTPGGLDALEARTVATPADADAWAALGVARFDLERYAEAAAAFDRTTKLAPNRAAAWSSLGEARVMASARDPMPADASSAFRKAAELDPKDPRARYFLAVARDLTGDHKGAIDDWLALLADTPGGAPWQSDLRRTIEQVGKIHKVDVAARLAKATRADPHLALGAGAGPGGGAVTGGVATAAIPGPTPEQLRAAAALAPREQDAMALGMVSRLEERLRGDPSNVDGWIMLMRSRMTLGDSAKAKAALASAKAANPGAAAKLDAAAAELGIAR